MKSPTLLAHDHSELDALLAAAFSALATGAIERSFGTVDVFWARLAMHIRAEHLHLFPAVLGAIDAASEGKEGGGSPSREIAQARIAQLREDHDYFMRELAAAIKELHALRGEQHDDEAAVLRKVQARIFAVSRRLEVHNKIEESEIYQWAGLLLEPLKQVALNKRIERELKNLPRRLETKSVPRE
ncbi:MAG TPA: hypothetical protein VFA51_09180 [Candidatus Udaeobacter sp.]|nr:hypothetical protein [Candidatus Udaeobacter sp.]